LYPFYADIKIEGNKLLFFEKNENFTRIKIDGRKIESDELFIYPGFRDCHGHIYSLGKIKSTIDFTSAKSFEECIEIIKKSKKTESNWITGRGWNNENWLNNDLPTREGLDKLFPNVPVYLIRVDGHCALANSKALEIAKIDSDSDNPDGGEILRFPDGSPNGILLDNAMNLVSKKIPSQSHSNKIAFIKEGMNQLAKVGIIETHDMDVHPELVKIFIGLDSKKDLKQYIKTYITAQNEEYQKYSLKRYKGNSYEIAGIKLYADGALGSKGAALEEAYSDDSDNFGIEILDYQQLLEKSILALKNDMDIAIHCIGDKANENVAKVYQKLSKYRYEREFRIEHAQILNSELPKKFSDFNITASIQPVHCISDAFMAEKRLGNRIEHSYLWKTLLENNVNILPGSDYPIESHNPLIGISAFVNRIPFESDKPWQHSEAIELEKALSLYYSPISINNLRNNFIVMDKNIFKTDKLDIDKIKNKFTLYNGFVTYNELL
jgi:predicted amidohydrolase YtcJ